MNTFLELLLNGILLGGVYALMACGLNLIFGVMRVINFAHGEFLTLGALATYSLCVTFKLPFWVALLVVPAVMAVFGYAMQVTLIARVINAPMIMSLLLTYALSTVLVNIGLYVYGGGFKGIPGLLTGSVKVLGIGLSEARLVAFAVAIGASAAVFVFLKRSLFGKAIRAVSQEPEIASISGISVVRVRNATFALGAAMAGLAGVLLAPIYAADPQMGSRFLIKVFAVVVVGGMGSYGGAIAGALLLGVVEVMGGYSLGQMAGSAAVYLVMIAVLLIRPRGLFGVGVRA